MKFRPCIDIHNGKIKQIVGGSLLDKGDQADENFVSVHDGGFYGKLYRKHRLSGGHIIILNPKSSEYYDADVREALAALREFPGGLQVGGGITDENASFFIEQGASHVIVTSFVFFAGMIRLERLKKLSDLVGREHLVLDFSCRKRDGEYYIVTDRWQKFTDTIFTKERLEEMEEYCSEFLVHGVDVEGKGQGIDEELVRILGSYMGNHVTYAGGIKDFADLELIKREGRNRVDVTVGSALDLFGGPMEFERVLGYCD